MTWQTVKTHMKCCLMQHFIRSALFAKTNQSSEKVNIITSDHPDLTVSNFMGNSIYTTGGNLTESSKVYSSYQIEKFNHVQKVKYVSDIQIVF